MIMEKNLLSTVILIEVYTAFKISFKVRILPFYLTDACLFLFLLKTVFLILDD